MAPARQLLAKARAREVVRDERAGNREAHPPRRLELDELPPGHLLGARVVHPEAAGDADDSGQRRRPLGLAEAASLALERPGLHRLRAPPPDGPHLGGVEGSRRGAEEAAPRPARAEAGGEAVLGEAREEERHRAQPQIGEVDGRGDGVLVPGRAGDEDDPIMARGRSARASRAAGERSHDGR